MVAFDVDADLAEDRRDRISDVDQGVERRDRHIALFRPNVVAVVSAQLARFSARVPMALFRIDHESGRILVIVISSLVKYKELGLGADEDRIGNAGELQVALGPLCYRSRIQPVAFLCDRVHGVGNQAERRVLGKRVDPEA